MCNLYARYRVCCRQGVGLTGPCLPELPLMEVLMAGGFTKDGAVQDQIDASLADEVNRARSRLPQGESLLECVHCGAAIPEARRKAMPGYACA